MKLDEKLIENGLEGQKFLVGTDHDHDTLEFTPWSTVKKVDHYYDTLDFVHGQWSKLTNFDHLNTVIFKFWPWSWSKMVDLDHLTTAILRFWPWLWSKIFDHLTMTPGRRPNGQKIVVILPPPPSTMTSSPFDDVIK